jgi:hypothetical protein
MSYVRAMGATVVVAPPPDPTSQALALLAASAVPCLPIAFGVAGGMYVGKGKSAVAPIVGGLIGGIISVLYLRGTIT